MKYFSVCSGIEAASVAWEPLGWTPVGFSEIEPFPSAVLAHHYPHIRNYGDLTKWKEWHLEPNSVDVLVGGTPCQSFSVAGLRKGLADPRGNLALVFLALADHLRPRWIVWENVPGVLSSSGGRDFGAFLGALGQLGYRWSYRVLDAQYFGVPQRRRRVFVVASLGDRRDPCEVLFERPSGGWDTEAQRPSRQGATRDAAPSAGDGSEGMIPRIVGALSDGAHMGGGLTGRMPTAVAYSPCVSMCLNAGAMGRRDAESETLIATGGYFKEFDPQSGGDLRGLELKDTAQLQRSQVPGVLTAVCATGERTHALTSEGFDASEDNTGRGCPIVPDATHKLAPALTSSGRGVSRTGDTRGQDPVVAHGLAVRRLTPEECEALQGFPRLHTRIPWKKRPTEDCPDGPRYKALGNSMAVPVMRWIGKRLQAVEEA